MRVVQILINNSETPSYIVCNTPDASKDTQEDSEGPSEIRIPPDLDNSWELLYGPSDQSQKPCLDDSSKGVSISTGYALTIFVSDSKSTELDVLADFAAEVGSICTGMIACSQY